MTSYRDYQPALHPTALAGPYGTSWGASQGEMKDRVITLAIDAVDAGLVLRAPADALPLLAADVALEQLPFGTDDELRTRIAGAWDTWPWAGTRTALEVVAGHLDFQGVVILTAREWGMSDAATLWARWWLLVTLGTPFSTDGAWDDAGTWDDGGSWDSDAPPEFAVGLRSAFRRFTNARDRGFIRFGFTDANDYYDDGGVWDGGEIVSELADTDTWTDDPAFFEVEI